MFAALIAGERIVLPGETSRIKPQPLTSLVRGFGFLAIFLDLDKVETAIVMCPFT